jgi:heme-degrading monooxygenase HmoA
VDRARGSDELSDTRHQRPSTSPTGGQSPVASWQHSTMIREHALLDVRQGQEESFERAFGAAKAIIASMPGFRSLTLDRGIEQPSRYLLLVEWDHIEDHIDGFRRSTEYEQWRQLLHHFYDPFPVVEHYEPVIQS